MWVEFPCGARRSGVSSNNPPNLSCPVTNKIWTAFGLLDPVANGISCPLLSFALVELCSWLLLVLLCYQPESELVVEDVPFPLGGVVVVQFLWNLCRVLQVPPQLRKTWLLWWFVRWWELLHCWLDILHSLIERNVLLLDFLLWLELVRYTLVFTRWFITSSRYSSLGVEVWGAVASAAAPYQSRSTALTVKIKRKLKRIHFTDGAVQSPSLWSKLC